MVKLRVLELLKEKEKTEYWLFKQVGASNYGSFRKLIHNESSMIHFETLDQICKALDVPVAELFASADNSAPKS